MMLLGLGRGRGGSGERLRSTEVASTSTMCRLHSSPAMRAALFTIPARTMTRSGCGKMVMRMMCAMFRKGDAPRLPEHAPPAIAQLGRWDPGYMLTLEKKVRGNVVDKIEWRCTSTIPVNLHTVVYEGATRLNWNVVGKSDTDEKTEYDYWALATSDDALREEVMQTNVNIAKWNEAQQAAGASHVSCSRCDIKEIIRKKGLRLAMSLQPGHPTAWYWTTETGDCTTLKAPAFGARFGMSRNRFFALEQHEQFCAKPADASQDPWWRVRALVTWFNQRRAAILRAGKFVCEDESGSWWYGRDAEKLPDWMADMACPHVTYLKKKPHPRFIELKNLCDVLTGIMICLEIQEGTVPMRSKAFTDRYQAHIAMSLRLLQTAGLRTHGACSSPTPPSGVLAHARRSSNMAC